MPNILLEDVLREHRKLNATRKLNKFTESKVTQAYSICYNYSPEQVRFVKHAVNDYMRCVNNAFDKGEPSNKDDVKAEWKDEGRIDELLNEEQFEELWEAVMTIEEAKSNESIKLNESIHLGDNKSSDDSYTHYTFDYKGKRYSFQECNDKYKVSYHRNKDFINGIYPYDEAEHPWAYSNHDDTKWNIVMAGKKIDTIDSDDLEPVIQLLQKYDAEVESRIQHN